MLALLVVINSRSEIVLIAACALFGFSVGNLITLPSLIVQREFPSARFGVLISLITAINQVTYAFGPGVVGVLHDLSGGTRCRSAAASGPRSPRLCWS